MVLEIKKLKLQEIFVEIQNKSFVNNLLALLRWELKGFRRLIVSILEREVKMKIKNHDFFEKCTNLREFTDIELHKNGANVS